MGYPDLQDGRPPRSRAGAELADGLVPAEMDSEEAAEYRPPQVPGTDRAAWRGNGTTARPGYAAPGYDGPGDGVAHNSAPGYDGPGNDGPGNGGPRHGSGPGPGAGRDVPGPGAGRDVPGPGRDVPGPGARTGAHRAMPGTRPGPGTGPAIRANSPWPSAPGTGPAAADASGRPADGRPPATEAAGRTGPPARRPAAGGRPWPPGPASTGPQPSYRALPDSSGDAPPGLAITREPPGARRRAAPPDSTPRSGRGGPVRGYPPGPGQPDPVYPPGQFSPWNRAATRAAWLGAGRAASGPAESDAEPGYSALALSDAAADLTATQTWAVIDGEPPPSLPATPRASRDWGSHAEESGPARRRTAAGGGDPGRPTGSRTTDSRTTDSRTTDSRTTDSRTTGDWTTSPRRARGTGPLAPGLGERTATGQRHADLSRPGAAELDATGPGAAAVAPAGAERTAQGPGTGGLGRPAGLDAPATGAGEHPRTGSRMAARRAADAARQSPSAFDESRRGLPPRAAATRHPAGDRPTAAPGRSGRRGRRHTAVMAGLLLAPVLVVVLVVAGYVYFSSRHAPAVPHAAASHTAGASHPAAAPNRPAATTLGPWKHIESRSEDPVPLTVTELFPAKFSASREAGTLTASKAGRKCTREVIGSKLAAAVRKADCTQVLRASYLSADRKIMATVGVLNLENATAAGKAGKAAGAVEFIKQLASAHGPTRNIAKGTGIVAAYVKGHYLILTWTEFANLRSPSGKSKRQELEAFSTGLVAGTANVSLTNRMVTGHPSGTSGNS